MLCRALAEGQQTGQIEQAKHQNAKRQAHGEGKGKRSAEGNRGDNPHQMGYLKVGLPQGETIDQPPEPCRNDDQGPVPLDPSLQGLGRSTGR